MSGKWICIVILSVAVVAGAGLYYLQIYGFYRVVTDHDGDSVQLVSKSDGQPITIGYQAFQAIDSNSSPIRYRACFKAQDSLENLTRAFIAVEFVVPRNAPGWFDCFDAQRIADHLNSGRARIFLSHKNIHYGVDRVVAVTTDGQGYIWHELNNCGRRAYDGTVGTDDCAEF